MSDLIDPCFWIFEGAKVSWKGRFVKLVMVVTAGWGLICRAEQVERGGFVVC